MVASPSRMNSQRQAARFPTPFMPESIPAEIKPAKALESKSPEMRKAIRIPSSFFVYQQERK